jgi:uncharacterized protein
LDASLPRATLINTEVRTMHSTVMGLDYQISTWYPPGYPKAGFRYPGIYLLDGETMLGQIIPMVLGFIWEQMAPDCLIVGVGHDFSTIEEWAKAREIDFTLPEYQENGLHNRADDFLSFMKTELIPMIDATFPVDPTDRCLAGYSCGGEFTLYTLLHEPELF